MPEFCVMQSSRLFRILKISPPENSSSAVEDALRVYDIRDPVDSLGHAMIDPWLTWLCTGITCGDNADEVPSASFLQHQWTSTVTLKFKWLVFLRKCVSEEEMREERSGMTIHRSNSTHPRWRKRLPDTNPYRRCGNRHTSSRHEWRRWCHWTDATAHRDDYRSRARLPLVMFSAVI